MDISRELLAYEVEYHVLQEEMLVSPSPTGVPHQTSTPDFDGTIKLENMNKNLKRQVRFLFVQRSFVLIHF